MRKNVALKAFCCLFLLLVFALSACEIFAAPYNEAIVNTINGNKGDISGLTTARNRVIGSIILAFECISVGAIVYAGIRYMYAGADEKANLKNGLLVLAVGAILVFGASTVVKLLIGAVNELNTTAK